MARVWQARRQQQQRRVTRAQRGVCAVLCGLAVLLGCAALGADARRCNETHRFQYVCEDDADDMPGMRTCPADYSAAWNTTHTLRVECRVHDGVRCDGPRVFTQERPCFFTFVFPTPSAPPMSLSLHGSRGRGKNRTETGWCLRWCCA